MSSSPEQDSQVVDERKRKRMQSNRESARRSRVKKQEQLNKLTGEITRFKAENTDLKAAINLTTQNYMMVEKENNILRAKHAELALRLENANSILRIYEEFTGMNFDILDSPEPNYPLFEDPIMHQTYASSAIAW